MHLFSIGALLTGSLLLPAGAAPTEWQSLRYDRSFDPVFPAHLLRVGVMEGEARVAIDTDANGKLVEWLVTGYTNKEFADAAVMSIKHWSFFPAMLKGEPVGTIVELSFQFSTKGIIVATTNMNDFVEGRSMRLLPGSFAFFPCMPSQLDQAPTPIVKFPPPYGTNLAKQGIKGTVRIDFYIDETGAVRMPCVAADDSGVLPALAIEALKQWKFSPPTSHGRPVLVKASEEFRFGGGS
jgi:TonB family protein